MFKVYQRLTRECRSVNQLNRVLISLAKKMTPSEFYRFLEEGHHHWKESPPLKLWVEKRYAEYRRQVFPHWQKKEETRKWAQKMRFLLDQSNKKKPEPFMRTFMARNLYFYTSDVIAAESKTLVICFTGVAQGMMLPLGVFLQHFDADEVDIALVVYPENKGYYRGIKGIGENIEETLTNLYGILPAAEYKRTVTIGTSAGGAPALLLALMHKLPAVLAVGISSPTDERWHEILGEHLGDYGKRLAAGNSQNTEIFLYCGVNASLDIQASHAWEGFIPEAQVMEIGCAGRKIGHNVFDSLVQEGRLSETFQQTLFNP